MDGYWPTSGSPHWAAVADLERGLAAQPGDAEASRLLGHALYAALGDSLSLTRDQTLEITSVQQAALAERVGRRILELDVPDEALRAEAQAILDRVAAGNQWTWERPDAAVVFGVLAVLAGLAAAVFGGLAGSLLIMIAGAVLSSAVLAMIVLRYRRQHWRINAERVAPLVWRPGV